MEIKLSKTQIKILKALSELILIREEEENNNKRTNINAYSISKRAKVSYQASKVNLIKFKDII